MTGALRLEAVSASYGDARVLEDVTLTLAPGRLMALLGPSGCGKTTLLRVIAGLKTPDAGDVWLGDERITARATERRGLGVVFQKPLLFPHMSVADNVGFGLRMRGIAPATIARDVEQALQWVQLEGVGHRRPHSLSGGQAQRVALARALVTQPRALLLDEPLTALDEQLRADMRTLIRTLHERLRITTLFVTHDQREAAELADDVALLLDGRLTQVGTTREVYAAPRSTAVARFFGWCVLEASDGTATMVAFHPAAVRLHRDDVATPALTVQGRVTRSVDLGYQARLAVELASGSTFEMVASGADADRLRPGDGVELFVPRTAVCTFSGAPGPVL